MSKVFISYSQSSEDQVSAVLNFAERLKSDGILVSLDQYETAPDTGWPRWCLDQLLSSDYVLLICDESYLSSFSVKGEENASNSGAGVIWEAWTILEDLYQSNTHNQKYIPIIFSDDNIQYIPHLMKGMSHYNINIDSRYKALVKHLLSHQKPTIQNNASLERGLRETSMPYRNNATPIQGPNQDYVCELDDFMHRYSSTRSQIFSVPQWADYVINDDDAGYLVTRPKLVNDVLDHMNSAKLHVLLGASGAGKTTFAKEIAYNIRTSLKIDAFWLNCKDIHRWDEEVESRIIHELSQKIGSNTGCFLFVDDAHIYFNEISRMVTLINTIYPLCKVLITLLPNIPKYYVMLDDNILITAISSNELRTKLHCSDIAGEIISKYLEKIRKQDWNLSEARKTIIELCKDSIYEIQHFLLGVSEEEDQLFDDQTKNSKGEGNVRPDLGDRFLGQRLMSLVDRYGREGFLTLIAVAVWSEFEIPVETSYLLRGNGRGDVGLGISQDLINRLAKDGELEVDISFASIYHKVIAQRFVERTKNIRALDILMREEISQKLGMDGDWRENLIRHYIAYEPRSMDLIAKLLCNEHEMLSLLSRDQQTINALVESIAKETSVLKSAEIFINLEWQNHKLSKSLMNGILSKIDQFVAKLELEDRIGPIVQFIAPMWYVEGDSEKKEGKRLDYLFDWRDPMSQIEVRSMECPYITEFGEFEKYKTEVKRILLEGGVSREMGNETVSQIDRDDMFLSKRSCACIKSIYYRGPKMCCKPILNTSKPGEEILKRLNVSSIAGRINEERDVKIIGYALSVIQFFSGLYAKALVEEINFQGLVEKLNKASDQYFALFCIIVLRDIDSRKYETIAGKIKKSLRKSVMDHAWPSIS